jgi:membrane protein DedA with SNARE-associated domain
MVPSGKHNIEWRFEPKSFETANVLGAIGSFSLFLACGLIFGMTLKSAQSKEERQSK